MVRTLLLLLSLVALPVSLMAATSHSVQVQVVDARGVPIKDAVVELHSAGQQKGRITFPWRMAMGQKDETFIPGTLIVAKGSTVAFPNLDRVRHSIYSFSKPARFEIDLYGRNQTRTQNFPASGTVKLGCNIHDQMRGYIRVVNTPHAARTDSNGLVTLRGVSGGRAALTVWHPQLRAPGGEMKRAIAVAASSNRHRIAVRLR
ncbi:MAG: methylamine utilization protein [Citromicrobium sp.]|nr:MAG: methylamine utilization protein [Citromicrobium sp.]